MRLTHHVSKCVRNVLHTYIHYTYMYLINELKLYCYLTCYKRIRFIKYNVQSCKHTELHTHICMYAVYIYGISIYIYCILYRAHIHLYV